MALSQVGYPALYLSQEISHSLYRTINCGYHQKFFQSLADQVGAIPLQFLRRSFQTVGQFYGQTHRELHAHRTLLTKL